MELEEFAPWLVIAITFFGGFLRILLLGTKGLWLDETFSVWLASQSTHDMLEWIVRIDQHPPLYYLLLHYWIALHDDGAYHVRLLSVVFGVATIPIMYLIGKRLSGALMGLAASWIFAFSLFNIYYAQESRMYTLLTFNAAVAIYALVRLLTDPRVRHPIGSQFRNYMNTWRTSGPVSARNGNEFSYKYLAHKPTVWRSWILRHRWSPIETIETDLSWIVFIVFTVATMLTHNTAVLFLAATNVFVAGLILLQKVNKTTVQSALHAPSQANWFKAQAGILLLWSPWIGPFMKQATAVYHRFWIPEPTWSAVIKVIKAFLNPSAPIPAGQATLIWTLYGVVLFLGLLHFRKKFSQLLFLTSLFALPFLGELIVSVWRPIFYDRTLIWTTIPLYLLLAAGVAQLKFRPLVLFMLGALGALNLFSSGDYYRFYQKEDWSTAAGYVALFAEKDDLVLFNSNFIEIPFNYYFESYEEGYAIQVQKQGVPLDLFESGIPEPEMTSADVPALISLLRGHGRVWLVYSHSSYTDPMGLLPQTLASQKKLIRTHDFLGGQVQLYEDP